jgi:hypothetical protein
MYEIKWECGSGKNEWRSACASCMVSAGLFRRQEMNTDIRKRFFEEFIEAVKSNTDCSEDDADERGRG